MSGGQGGNLPARSPFTAERAAMVSEQLVKRGIHDDAVLAAMGEVPRHAFVDPAQTGHAYDDRPLPIGFGQTISQPFMVARVTELAAAKRGERALEVGAGCGYQAAVLAQMGLTVFGVEIVPQLAARARAVLDRLGLREVTLGSFDGSAGWPAHAPYDVIIVSAAAPRVPTQLVHQLSDGGRLVVPVGDDDEQRLMRVRRRGDDVETVVDTACRYVSLVGRFGVGSVPTVS